ncbi:hypothetical protein [Escherichia fergusonii]|uniref:hypothetical protein n=1 Tax=Escherichia fergusonii TaxID=564 RepID=UPI0020CBB032|nr:hypothetical protein [Escherichia fergusonii]MCP9661366.1 hypothetical protein [Escherichia fergusonii]
MTQLINHTSAHYSDDGKNYLDSILWHMNAAARARTRSTYCPPPKNTDVVVIAKPEHVAVIRPAEITSGTAKTHTGVVLKNTGERTVKLRETVTAWSAGVRENYDKKTGYRLGASGSTRLLLDTVKPIRKKGKK